MIKHRKKSQLTEKEKAIRLKFSTFKAEREKEKLRIAEIIRNQNNTMLIWKAEMKAQRGKNRIAKKEAKNNTQIKKTKSGIYIAKTPKAKLTQSIRCSIKYKQWRQQILIRDDFTCQQCQSRGGCLEAHHIKPFHKLLQEVKQNLPLFDLYSGAMIYTPLWDFGNGITLCKICHNLIKK